MSKIATGVAAIGLSLCMAFAASAAPGRGGGGGGGHPGGGGGHPGGGGGAHFGGGGGGAHFGGGGGAHFTAHAAPHISGGAPHFSGHVGGGGGPRFSGRGSPSFRSAAHGPAAHTAVSHVTPSVGHATPSFSRATPGVGGRSFAGAHTLGPNHFSHAAFVAHRNFAASAAFHPFWHPGWHPGWHPYNHVGWLGPVFWPYAYGNLFYYSLWPDDYGYDDPLWVYGYGDIYQGIFSPDVYDQYVQGPGAPQRMATLTQSMTQSCDDEASEVTGWPIDQIQSAVQPNPDQTTLLDDLGNAVVKASDVIKSHCPTTVSFTPTGRVDDMQQRLQGMVQAVDMVRPPLGKFYDSLSDEQKARFNQIGASTQTAKPEAANAPPQNSAGNASNPHAQCDAQVMAWPTDQINRVVQPNDAQRAKLDALQSAATSAEDTIKAACPTQMPATPPERLAAAGSHLKAMLQAVDSIRPALHDFYDSLNNDQKARFNTLGKQLFAQTAQTQKQ
jgi:hypothetical protein